MVENGYTIEIERLREVNKELLEACKYLEKVLLLIEKVQVLPVPAILRNNIECLQQRIAKAEAT